MALSKHPNVLRVRGEWIDGSRLFIAVRYMTHGTLIFLSLYRYSNTVNSRGKIDASR